MHLSSETFFPSWPFLQHFIGLVKNHHFNFVEIKVTLLDHIEHTSRCAADHVHTHLQTTDVLLHGLATKTSMNLNIEMVAKCKCNFLRLFSQLACR